MAAYISKEEKKIPINDPTGKWTDMTLLPEWEEEFYNVYTAKKHGKWVMLKALKKEYADDPKYQEMLEREFDTRYNLAHANIVMVNDYELIPDIGMAIITDDVYGYSLRRLIDEKKLSPMILRRIETQLVDAIDYMQENHIIHHPITPDKIIFTEMTENLKLIDVGYDHKSSLTPQDTADDILAYGKILSEVLDNIPNASPRLRKIANKCIDPDPKRRYSSFSELYLAIERRSSSQLYVWLIAFICAMVGLLVWLTLGN
ncbi:MAG: protein kinase [Muribaculaceae bacterium]|jgi:serine/threonine protein kinase|nr:protein kinase [Muribaculaceae bacterium]